MNYLVVCKSNNQHYILMTQDTPHQIQGYSSKEEVMASFKGYTDGWTGMGYERSMSATIGMMNMQPIAVEAPENVSDLQKYIKEMKAFSISGGAIGRGYIGLPVNESILELKQFDIWKESMKQARIA